MEWNLAPQGYVPFEHVHYLQDEIFRVMKGELKVIIDGKEHIARERETITVPKGARHIASNNTTSAMESVVEYTPALDHDVFMKCLCGLTQDVYLDKRGEINIPMMGYCLMKMKCKAMARPTKIPAPVFRIALGVFHIMGGLKGWEKRYRKYAF